MTTHLGENSESLRPEDPRQLGEYRLTARLGRGGMGTVYLGTAPSGHQVAVKVINRELGGEQAFRDRFRREVTAAGQVRRFCTAPVLDAELDRDPLYIVTEYIEGPSLESAVAERGALPGSDLEGLAVGVATALAAIHGAGIVHRDLKPSNVLLSSTGPRVIDFGIARALDAADGPTRTGQFVGTPNYVPPELLRGEPVTPASDVFSWGCVVAYAGTGRAPFAGATVPEIFYKVAHDPPRLDGLDPALREIVAAALDKDPNNRPSVQDLLGRMVGHSQPDPAHLAETVQAGWHGPPPTRAANQPGLPPTRVAGAETTRNEQPRRSRRSRRTPLLAGGAAALAAVIVAVVALVAVLGPDGPPENTATAFSDTFSDSDSGWEGGTFTSQYGYFQGRYRLESGSDAQRIKWVPKKKAEEIPERSLTTVTATVVEGAPESRYGLSCRGNDNDAGLFHYAFLVRNDGKGALLRKVAGPQGSKELANVSSVPGVESGQANKVQIACEPQDGGKEVRLRLWVNGEQVMDLTDTDKPLVHGWVGMIAERGGNQAKGIVADFDDFDLSEIRD